MARQPMQPVILADDGVIRFQENKIIRWLNESGKLNLNEIAIMQFSSDDHMQIAQLLGYSVSGFGDLPYARVDMIREADRAAEAISKDL